MSNGEKDFIDSNQVTHIDSGVRIVGGLRSNNTIINAGVIEGEVVGSEGYIANNKGILRGSLDAKWAEIDNSLVQGPINANEHITISKNSRVEGIVKTRFLSQHGYLTGKMIVDDMAIFSEDSNTMGNISTHLVSIELGARVNGFFNITGGEVTDAIRDKLSHTSQTIQLNQKTSLKEDFAPLPKAQPAALDFELNDEPLRAHIIKNDVVENPPTKVVVETSTPTIKSLKPKIEPIVTPIPEIADIEVIKIDEKVEKAQIINESNDIITKSVSLVNIAIYVLLALFVVLVVLVVMKYMF